MINQDKIQTIVERIVNGYNPDKIILFGSYASQHATEDSDLDILVIKQSVKPRHKRANDIWPYLYGTMVPIDLIVYSPEEVELEEKKANSFISNVLKTGSVLYEKQH